MKKIGIILCALVAAGAAAWLWLVWPSRAPALQVARPHDVVWLDVGLEQKDQELWHHVSEGSEMLPLSVLESLRNVRTGNRFIEDLGRYGFLIESAQTHKLPVGWTSQVKQLGNRKVPFVGINCAACHTGELQFQGKSIRIDGAPNLFSLEEFFLDLRDSLAALGQSKLDTFLFVRQLIRTHHHATEPGEFMEVSPQTMEFLNAVNTADGLDPREKKIVDFLGDAYHSVMDPNTDAAAEDPALHPASALEDAGGRGALAEAVKALLEVEDLMQRRLATFKTLAAAIDSSIDLGPGRGDSFGIIRDLLFPFDPVTLDAPVSTPHLFGFKHFEWIHWDGNTTSVVDRNIAQAIALGADFNRKTMSSDVLPRNLAVLETIAAKIRAPKWPESIFGSLDRAKADRGRELFGTHCHRCHHRESVYPAEDIGTDPARARGFQALVAGLPLPHQLASVASQTKSVLFKQHQVSTAEAAAMERVASPTWRATGGYIARSLEGVWATAPFLHNGSVPTLYDLLQPAAQRPATFPLGREFDPVRVGIAATIEQPLFMLDTRIPGNGNAGHEYGAQLSDADKWDLVEYLKSL